MSTSRRLLILLASMACLADFAGAATAVQSDGGAVLEVATGSAAARVLFPDGRALRIALPAGAEVTALHDLGRRWLATGTLADPDGSRRLWLALGGRLGFRDLAAPAPAALAIQRRPVALVEGGELVGLAWLEGAAAGGLGVRAAARNASGWTEPEWVSPPGRGSQLALSGSVLADGTWLLVWSAFDGQDDEIVAARRSRGAWEKPQRIAADNGVPDITPSLTATSAGAIVAWSRYQAGAYTLLRAAFDGESWRELAPGERGGLYPSFRGGSAGPALLFYDARRTAWTVLDLDERGMVLRRAEAAGPASDEPPLLFRDAEGVRLRAVSGGVFTGSWRSPR